MLGTEGARKMSTHSTEITHLSTLGAYDSVYNKSASFPLATREGRLDEETFRFRTTPSRAM